MAKNEKEEKKVSAGSGWYGQDGVLERAVQEAVSQALTRTYNTVWLINDVETQECSLYYTDLDEAHREAIRSALEHGTYTQVKTQYVNTMVAEEDREWMQEQVSLPYILKEFETKDQYSVNFVRNLSSGPRHYRIDFARVNMPGGKTGVMLGFKDVDEAIMRDRALQRALDEARKAEEENRRLMAEVQSAARLTDVMASASSLLTNMQIGRAHV